MGKLLSLDIGFGIRYRIYKESIPQGGQLPIEIAEEIAALLASGAAIFVCHERMYTKDAAAMTSSKLY